MNHLEAKKKKKNEIHLCFLELSNTRCLTCERVNYRDLKAKPQAADGRCVCPRHGTQYLSRRCRDPLSTRDVYGVRRRQFASIQMGTGQKKSHVSQMLRLNRLFFLWSAVYQKQCHLPRGPKSYPPSNAERDILLKSMF